MRRCGKLPAFLSDVKARHDWMVGLVERMREPSAGSELALRNSKGQAMHKQLPKTKTPHEQESIKNVIAATDAQIDALVYESYGLTEHEIRVVEEKHGP